MCPSAATIARASVVFPLPSGPVRATTSPGWSCAAMRVPRACIAARSGNSTIINSRPFVRSLSKDGLGQRCDFGVRQAHRERTGRMGVGRSRQPDGRRRPRPRLALQLEPAAVGFDELAGERQAETRAALRVALLADAHAVERAGEFA